MLRSVSEEPLSYVRLTVGAARSRVSMASAGARAPATLGFPASSVNREAATPTDPVAAIPGVGTKVAVKTVPDPLKPTSDPPTTSTSSAVKSVASLERVKVMAAV